MAYSDPLMFNNALAATGSSYRVPTAVDSSGAAQAAVAQMEQQKAQQKASSDKLWGLVGVVANMYTGGAFGAAKNAAQKNDGKGWQPPPVNPSSYEQYSLANRTGPIVGSVPGNPY